MRQKLTPEGLEALINMAEDNKAPIDVDLISALEELHSALIRRMARSLESMTAKAKTLEERTERYKILLKGNPAEGEFTETGLDSADVADALLYQLQTLRTYKLSRAKVIHILYEMYASWLASKGERLFIEHPVATEYGPMFWRVYKRLDTRKQVSQDRWESLCASNPGVAAFCRNAARKYYDYSDGDLNKIHMKSRPYKNASKEKNGGKWNKEISDNEIYAWKRENNK